MVSNVKLKNLKKFAKPYTEINNLREAVDLISTCDIKWTTNKSLISYLNNMTYRLHHDSSVTCWEELVDELIEELENAK